MKKRKRLSTEGNKEITTLHGLPRDLLQKNSKSKTPSVGNYLSLSDREQLSMVNKPLFSIFKEEVKALKLLRLVAFGQKKEAEEMIIANPRLLLEEGLIRDEAGRQIYGTALRIALGAKDVSIFSNGHEGMVEMIKRNMLTLLPDGQEEFAIQYAEQFPPGWEEQEEERKEKDNDAVKQAFNHLFLNFGLDTFQAYLKKQTECVIKTGYHFNDNIINEMQKLYLENFHFFTQEYFARNESKIGITIWGNIQRYFPACLSQAMCNGFTNNGARSKKVINTTDHQMDKYIYFYHPHLGEKYFIHSYGDPARTWRLSSTIIFDRIVDYVKSRNAACEELHKTQQFLVEQGNLKSSASCLY